MKVLHLASFEGNLGDNANIGSLRHALTRDLGLGPFTALEMREYYWKERHFDRSFAELANSHDLLIIGGGNYFEVWVETSCSGMSIDIPIDILKLIRTPILFYGLGFDPAMGYTPETLARSREWFKYLLTHPERYFVTVRNDGSHECLTHLHGPKIAERIKIVPDGGFLLEPCKAPHPWLPNNTRWLAINLAGDMLELRHPGGDLLDSKGFCTEFAGAVEAIAATHHDLAIIFVPHIFSDLDLIARVIALLPDQIRRRRVYVAPYTHGDGPHHAIFALYSAASCTLGVRFHANVCPIALGTPTLGLINYPQIEATYAGLGIPHRAVSIREAGFASTLILRVDELLTDPATARAENSRIRIDITRSFAEFVRQFRIWMGL